MPLYSADGMFFCESRFSCSLRNSASFASEFLENIFIRKNLDGQMYEFELVIIR